MEPSDINDKLTEQQAEIERLQNVLREFIRVVNECDTVCAVGSPCLCDVEYNLWAAKE